MEKIIMLLYVFMLSCTPVHCQKIITHQYNWEEFPLKEETYSVGAWHYSIKNDTTETLLMFFIEKPIDSMPILELLRKKLFTRYRDFYLAMIEYEPNMILGYWGVVPDAFVKCITPNEIFNVIVPFNERNKNLIDISRHILVLKESVFHELVGMPYFIDNLHMHNFEYPFDYIVLDIAKFQSFVSRKKKT